MSEQTSSSLLHVGVAPHIKHPDTVPSIMLSVAMALGPALAASVYFFGVRALLLTMVSVAVCLITEWAIVRFMLKRPSTLGDYSALVTGLLLAFNLPYDLPVWLAALGSVFAIAVAKWAFGGLGSNFINPALAGRAFLTASYPAAMTTFGVPQGWAARGWTINGMQAVEGITGATPLAALKETTAAGTFEALDFQAALPELFFGNIGGCLGETSAAALLLGAVFLLYKRIISFRIPVCYIGTVFLLSWVFNGTTQHLFTTESLIVPVYQVLAGGLMLGALFMATDMVTSPVTPVGKAIFGCGCGILTFLIRKFGGYPEGVSYSILLMNLAVPHIDRHTAPRVYGASKATKR